MRVISSCAASDISCTATSLLDGNLVAFPTETVYGLGADATNQGAVSRIYKVKGRPTEHPLIVHISSIKQLDLWAREVPEYAIELARNFWPGPMTLILPRTGSAKDFITGGQDNVGIRVPSHAVALALLEEFEAQGGIGIVAPSANRFGAVSPTCARDVELEIGNHLSMSDQILDGGNCEIGIESTIVDCTNAIPSIIRPGAITSEMVEKTIELSLKLINESSKCKIKAPGMLESHYAPKARVILNRSPSKGDGFIALASIPTPTGAVRLASPTSIHEYAQVLYAAFRKADSIKLNKVFVNTPSGEGLAIAITDRLEKASTKNFQ
jgi:L-threonylcarbamoyladenylate synthase